MNKRLVKMGGAGAVVIALCCFTPILVWVLAFWGLSVAVVYLDYVLFPLLGLFLLILFVGLLSRASSDK